MNVTARDVDDARREVPREFAVRIHGFAWSGSAFGAPLGWARSSGGGGRLYEKCRTFV